MEAAWDCTLAREGKEASCPAHTEGLVPVGLLAKGATYMCRYILCVHLISFICTTALSAGYCYLLHYVDMERRAQRG